MTRLNTIYFTSDWHLGQKNILNFCNRPFADLETQRKALITRFNATVSPNSTTYFLGDMGHKSAITSILPELNGKKILILGNHDKGINSMYQCGFDAVLMSGSLMLKNNRITMSHYPLFGVFREDVTGYARCNPTDNWHRESVHKHRALPDFGQYHLHGHTHIQGEDVKSGRQWDVGGDGNNFTPVSLRQVESWIASFGE